MQGGIHSNAFHHDSEIKSIEENLCCCSTHRHVVSGDIFRNIQIHERIQISWTNRQLAPTIVQNTSRTAGHFQRTRKTVNLSETSPTTVFL